MDEAIPARLGGAPPIIAIDDTDMEPTRSRIASPVRITALE